MKVAIVQVGNNELYGVFISIKIAHEAVINQLEEDFMEEYGEEGDGKFTYISSSSGLIGETILSHDLSTSFTITECEVEG